MTSPDLDAKILEDSSEGELDYETKCFVDFLRNVFGIQIHVVPSDLSIVSNPLPHGDTNDPTDARPLSST